MREQTLGADGDLNPSLTEAQVARIVALGHEERCAKGEVLFRQGETFGGVYLLLDGCFKASSVNAQGSETVLRLHYPGSLLGLTALGVTHARDATLVALEDSRLCHVSRDAMRDLMEKDGALGFHIAQLLLERLASFHFLVHSVLTGTVEQRVARALLGFSLPCAGADGASQRDLRLSQEELAQIVAARRPTVSQVLNNLAEAGLVGLERRRIVIRDPDGLSRYVAE